MVKRSGGGRKVEGKGRRKKGEGREGEVWFCFYMESGRDDDEVAAAMSLIALLFVWAVVWWFLCLFKGTNT